MTVTTETLTIRHPDSPQEWAQATALLHDYVEWLRAAVGVEPLDKQPALRTELADLASTYDGERAELFAIFEGPMAVGMAALRHHSDRRSELKRMYLRPVTRGRGLADLLIEHALRVAKDRGQHSVWLETMEEVMAPALAVYRRHGFKPTNRLDPTIVLDRMVLLERSVRSEEAGPTEHFVR